MLSKVMDVSARVLRRTVLVSILIVLVPVMVLAQSNISKRVTLELKDVTLEKALAILSISYDVEFSYSDDKIPVAKIVSVSILDETLGSALDKLLDPVGVDYRFANDRVILKKAASALSQTIRGNIVDQITNEFIPGVNVTVQGGSTIFGATSDGTGKFKVLDVPVGRVNISCSFVGYKTQTLNNILIGTGKELVLEIRMMEAIIPIDEVVVLAQKSEDAPGNGVALTSSHSLSVEETKRFAGSLGDPARAVTAFAGVTASNDESNALIVRGNSPRGVLWRIEGIEVSNPNHFTTEGASGGVVSALSSNVIERSDFLTGAFPAQYGNALSGVFDINLRNGNNEHREYSLGASLLGVEASAEGPLTKSKTSSYLVNYRYSTLSILDKLGFNLNDAGQYKDYQDLSFKIHSVTRAGVFSMFGIGAKSQSDQTTEDLFNNHSSDFGVLGLTYDKTLDENTSLRGSLSWSATQIGKDNEISSSGSVPIQVEEQYTKSYGRVSFAVKRKISSRYVLEGGLIQSFLKYDFYLRNRDPDNIPYPEIVNFKEDGNSSITQTFLFARQYFSPTLFGYYGAHFLSFALTKDQSIEPRLGISWQPHDAWSLGLAYGKHSRIENLQYYLARDHQVGGNEVQINKNLGFTRAHHIVASYDQRIHDDIRLKVEAYFQKLYKAPVLSDLASIYSSINEDTGFITDTLVNTGEGKNYGIEVSVEKRFEYQFYYLVNGTLYQSKFSIDSRPELNTSYNGNYNVHLLVGKEFTYSRKPNRLGLNVKVTAAGGKRFIPIDEARSVEAGMAVYDWDNAFEKRLPDYFRTDFQIVYRNERPACTVEWRLDIQNITNHRNALNYYYDADSEMVQLRRTVGFLPLLSCRVEF